MKGASKRTMMLICLMATIAQMGCVNEQDDVFVEDDGDGDPPTVMDAVPILRIEADQGREVQIYEPVSGFFFVASTGPIGTIPVGDEMDLTGRITDIYQRLRPGEEVPSAVRDAQLRQDSAVPEDFLALFVSTGEAGQGDALPADGREEAISDVDDQALSTIPKDPYHEWWQDTMCNANNVDLKFPSYYGGSDCAVHRTGGGTWTHNDAMETAPGCLSYDGTINCRLRWKAVGASSSTYQTIWDERVAEGYYAAAHYFANPLGDTLDWQFKIFNADGNRYHRRFMFTYNWCPWSCDPNWGPCLCQM